MNKVVGSACHAHLIILAPQMAAVFSSLQGMGFSVQQIFGGPSWSNQAAGPLDGNNGQPVVVENSAGIFDIIPGNQIDFSVSCTTDEVVDVAVSITYAP